MKRFNKLLKYELLTIIKGGYIIGFGLVLPSVLLYLITAGSMSEIPEEFRKQAFLGVFFGLSTLIPLAGVFLGHSANYSREFEQKVPHRLKLFGISPIKLISAKLAAQLIFVIVGTTLYTLFAMSLGLEIDKPVVFFSMFMLIVIHAILEFILAHGIVETFKKFGVTYAVTMILYFGFMIVSGNMGLPTEKLPEWLQFVGENMLPFIEYTNFNMNLINGNELNWSALIGSHLSFALISFGVLVLSRLVSRRV